MGPQNVNLFSILLWFWCVNSVFQQVTKKRQPLGCYSYTLFYFCALAFLKIVSIFYCTCVYVQTEPLKIGLLWRCVFFILFSSHWHERKIEDLSLFNWDFFFRNVFCGNSQSKYEFAKKKTVQTNLWWWIISDGNEK